METGTPLVDVKGIDYMILAGGVKQGRGFTQKRSTEQRIHYTF